MQVELTAERVAHNQSTFRNTNEELKAAAERLVPEAEKVPFICECPDPICKSVTLLTPAEYETVRSRGDWFLVVPGHEVCVVDGVDVARIERRHDTFSVMEKVGRAGEQAEQLDPRR